MKSRSTPIPDGIADRMKQCGRRERKLEQDLANVREERDSLILQAHDLGASNYATSKLIKLDITQVGRIIKGARK
jgi:hypothetical protein